MNINQHVEKILKKNGWEVECENPLEIRHEDGAFATLWAATIVIEYLVREDAEENGIRFSRKCKNITKNNPTPEDL